MFLTADEAAFAVQCVWRRHVACTSGVGGVTALPALVSPAVSLGVDGSGSSVDPALAASADRQALVEFASYADSFREGSPASGVNYDCQYDATFRLTCEDVREQACSVVRNRFSAVGEDGGVDGGGDAWTQLHRPRTSKQVRAG
jgi:hypothetical protein